MNLSITKMRLIIQVNLIGYTGKNRKIEIEIAGALVDSFNSSSSTTHYNSIAERWDSGDSADSSSEAVHRMSPFHHFSLASHIEGGAENSLSEFDYIFHQKHTSQPLSSHGSWDPSSRHEFSDSGSASRSWALGEHYSSR